MAHTFGIMRDSSKAILWCVVLCALGSPPAWADDVGLAWDPNTETDLAGYKVYYGTASRTYGPPVTIGLQTTYTVTNLPPGTYYFAVTAYNTAGLESGFSNEVSANIPGTPSGCDCNGDGQTNVSDIQTLVNVVLGAIPGGSAYDVNRDGVVDIVDVQILVNVILGLRSCP
ncbi:MAG: fibronectin type III domain-containing protein [Acidobacteria bacterium]|nr:fibronectin type III domain-containing protein [Acidobacteriota bacterium]